jgi:hypothetical protein
MTEAEARRDERAAIVAWLRQEAARYRRLEPVLSLAARALEATAYLIETHAPHATDLPDTGECTVIDAIARGVHHEEEET